MLQVLTGSRIREKRLDLGMRQADLAAAVGISPSYLNLIEHNRRRIGGKLLADIARRMEVDAAALTEGADAALIDQLRAAAAASDVGVEFTRTEDVAARYPGWSALIVAQAARISALEARLQVLNDRMTYDPQLATSLHEVISAVTSIRSTASILVGTETIDADWQRRFHDNIYDDSLRLAASSEALVGYLDAPDHDRGKAVSPLEEIETFFAQDSFHVAEIELGETPAQVVAKSGLLQGARAQSMAMVHLARYASDAAKMPLQAFASAAVAAGYDPADLAATFGTDIAAVLRRLASLPAGDGHPPMGLAICDASGTLTLLKTVPGFALPRAGATCPLWPVFAALHQPNQPIQAEVALPGQVGTRFLCYAVATPVTAPRFDQATLYEATMLVMPDPPEGAGPVLPLGVSCRICPREDCQVRREPSALFEEMLSAKGALTPGG